MRETDFTKIESDNRSFIKTQEWTYGKPYHFYLTGHEKVTKVSQRTGNPFTLYYLYVLEILEDGAVCAEETLSLFASQAQAIKKARPMARYFCHENQRGKRR